MARAFRVAERVARASVAVEAWAAAVKAFAAAEAWAAAGFTEAAAEAVGDDSRSGTNLVKS